MLDTVNDSMTSAISLFHPIATMNSDINLQALYFDPENGVVVCGVKREVGEFGAMFVKGQYGRDNEVKITDRNFETTKGVFNYNYRSDYSETGFGLPGGENEKGDPIGYEVNRTTQEIEKVKASVSGEFEVGLNPGVLHQYMSVVKTKHKVNFENTKINIQFTAGVPKGYLIGEAKRINGELIMETEIPIKNRGNKKFQFGISEKSKLKMNQITDGVLYMMRQGGKDNRGRAFVDVARPYSEGIRFAVQSFKMGIIKPGDPGYDVNPDPTNGIMAKNVIDFPFMYGQDRSKIAKAPMMTFDYDVFYSLMHSLKGYDYIIMKFKNYSTPVYIYAPGSEYMPEVEAVLSPTIQHVKGRIWLP